MSGFAIPMPRFRAFDADGAPLAGGKLYSYEGGTDTPLATYTDATLGTPNENPVVLDAEGSASVFVPEGVPYKFLLADADDVPQAGYPVDSIEVPSPTPVPQPGPVPIGGMIVWGNATPPEGWLICDGSEISRATYASLFAAIGTTFGAGDASTTFNIPDFRQRFPLGTAASGTGNVLGGTGGSIDHTHMGGAHTHDVTVPRDGWGGNYEDPSLAGRLRTADPGVGGADGVGVQATGDKTVTSASGGAVATTAANPPFLSIHWIIKAEEVEA